jgi:hypothetical protein
MNWASAVVGHAFDDDASVRPGIVLGTFNLAVAYQRTTVFSKFYPTGRIPPDAELEADLIRFMRPLAQLYRAKERGIEPGTPSPDLLAFREELGKYTAPLKVLPKGQGRGLSGPARKAIEYEAMHRARQWLKDHEFKFEDVSATESFDFRAQKGGQEWVIEVKGTTGGPSSVLLTANEVELHRRSYPRNALIVVHGILLSEDGARASGGEVMVLCPWELDEERLTSICYEYRLV